VKPFSEKESRIMLAELAVAIEYMHSKDIVHRDLKIENVSIDYKGHIKIIDFGMAIHIESDLQPMIPSGSLIYMAPELLSEHIGGIFTDWWAYGVLAHELLTGCSPWSSLTNNKAIANEIINCEMQTPLKGLSKHAGDFICSLLKHDFRQRLGNHHHGQENNIRKHSFFKSIKWNEVEDQKNPPAFVPSQNTSTTEFEERDKRRRYEILRQHDLDRKDAGYSNGRSGNGGGGGGRSRGSRDDEVEVKKKQSWVLGYPHSSKMLIRP
jgi:serine/threonine protein kinase